MEWQTFEGKLTEFDPEDFGAHFDDYQIEIYSGDLALIQAESAEFDTAIKILRITSAGEDELASNDDGGDGTNSLLLFRAEYDSKYTVRVTSAYGRSLGRYRVHVGRRAMKTTSFRGNPDPRNESGYVFDVGHGLSGRVSEGLKARSARSVLQLNNKKNGSSQDSLRRVEKA